MKRFLITTLIFMLPTMAAAEWWQGKFVIEGEDIATACLSSPIEWFGVIEIGKSEATYSDDTHCTFQHVEPIIGLDAVILSERCEGTDGDPVEFRRSIIMSQSQLSHERDTAGIIRYPGAATFVRCPD